MRSAHTSNTLHRKNVKSLNNPSWGRQQTVCVRQNYVSRALSQLKGTKVGVACVIGFHEGTHGLGVKVSEARTALDAGAAELDVVLNREHLLSRDYGMVFEELCTLRGVSTPDEGVVMKVILETSQLGEDDVIAACTLAGYAGMDFVKTSTGFLGRGASLEDVRVMDAVAEYLHQRGVGLKGGHGRTVKMKVKASGGIRSIEDAVGMIEAGAMRIGTSSGMKIVQEATAAAGEVQSKGEDKAGANEKEHGRTDY